MSRGSFLPEGLSLVGEIRGQGDLVVAGSVEGPIAIDGHLTIEATSIVRGDVKARAMVIRGTLIGPAVADETIRLEAFAKMVGDARAERVSVVEGALLRGRITMTGSQAVRRSAPPPPVAPALRPSAAPEPSPQVPNAPPFVAARALEPKVTSASPQIAPREEREPIRKPPPSLPSERRPPEPLIPGVGRQRARRKDGVPPS